MVRRVLKSGPNRSCCSMSSEKQPGVLDIAVISGVLGLVLISVIAYFVSRCFCRQRHYEDGTYDDVRSLERIHNSVFIIPFYNQGFNPMPPIYNDVDGIKL